MQLLLIVTFKDLQKVIESQPDYTSYSSQQSELERLRGKLFWIWDQQEHKQEDIRTKRTMLLLAYNKMSTERRP